MNLDNQNTQTTDSNSTDSNSISSTNKDKNNNIIDIFNNSTDSASFSNSNYHIIDQNTDIKIIRDLVNKELAVNCESLNENINSQETQSNKRPSSYIINQDLSVNPVLNNETEEKLKFSLLPRASTSQINTDSESSSSKLNTGDKINKLKAKSNLYEFFTNNPNKSVSSLNKNPLHIITSTSSENEENSNTYSEDSQNNYYKNIYYQNNLHENLPNSSPSSSSNLKQNQNNITPTLSSSNLSLIFKTSNIDSNLDLIINPTESDSDPDNEGRLYIKRNNLNLDLINRDEGSSSSSSSNQSISNNRQFQQNIKEKVKEEELDIETFKSENSELYKSSLLVKEKLLEIKDIKMSEIFRVSDNKCNQSTNYIGGVDINGNIHLNSKILEDPLFIRISKLVPGKDFVEGYDYFTIYDYDNIFFKTMIKNTYEFKTEEILLDYFDNSPKTWYNLNNIEEVRKVLLEVIEEKYNLKLEKPIINK
jgi:hypothetical protein